VKKAVIFVHDLYEELELWVPFMRLKEEKIEVILAGPEEGKVYLSKHGYPCKAERAISKLKVQEIDIAIIPGGYAPDKLRREKSLLTFLREMNALQKTIAFICHGGWVPISAKILKGKKVTGAQAIRDDLENAGAQFVDQEVVVDGHLISSRSPLDLPFFCRAILSANIKEV
jgi:protease I